MSTKRQQAQRKQQSPTREQIAEFAYELYEKRGREAGHELEDWLMAEEVLSGRSPNQAQQKIGSEQSSKPRMTTSMIEEGTNPWEHAAQAVTHTTNRLK